MPAPNLSKCPVSCNSWVIVDKTTRKAVGEIWSKKQADILADMSSFEVLTAYEYLVELNRQAKDLR